MKKIGKPLALFAVALLLAATCGCSLTLTAPKEQTAPATTAVVTVVGQEDDLIKLRSLFQNLFRNVSRADTTVVCDDPSVGVKLRAASSLTKNGQSLTYQAKVDRLNDPASADRFTTSETLAPITGTPDQIRADYTGLFLWDRVATGLILATPAFSQNDFDARPIISLGDGERTLSASVPDGKLESFFGLALPDVSGMRVEVTYTEAAILSMQLTYTTGEAAMRVTVKYGY